MSEGMELYRVNYEFHRDAAGALKAVRMVPRKVEEWPQEPEVAHWRTIRRVFPELMNHLPEQIQAYGTISQAIWLEELLNDQGDIPGLWQIDAPWNNY